MSKEKSTQELREKITRNFNAFLSGEGTYEDRVYFVNFVVELIESEKAKAAKCSGCGKDSSYCANCERLLQT